MTDYMSGQDSGGHDTPDPAAVAAALDLAECTELEGDLRRRTGREMYEHGYEDGWREGYEHGARLLEESWPSVIRPVIQDRPSHADLEERRWGPGGREHFADSRSGDRHPQEAA